MEDITIKINIDYIRHAQSYANLVYEREYRYIKQNGLKDLQTIDRYIQYRTEKYPDALITEMGKKQSINLGNKFKKRIQKADMICCSELRRTMETALISCRDIHKKIYILPYISEIDTNYDNCPLEFNVTHMRQYPEKYKKHIIKYRLLSYIYINSKYNSIDGYPVLDNKLLLENDKSILKPTTSDHNKFYSIILPKLYIEMFKNSKKREYNIIIFTHSGFIRNHFGFNGHMLGKLDITKDKRFANIDKYVSKRRTPNNTNIYTEHIYMKDNKIYYEIAKPCVCFDICGNYHQIPLDRQNNIN